MPLQGLEQAKKKTEQIIAQIRGPLSEKTVTEICIIGSGYAALLTPVDTSLLINSQFGNRRVAPAIDNDGTTVRGMVGYTAAYAAAVNSMSGRLKGKPRADFGVTRAGDSFGGGTGVGNYWSPDAEPDFLKKGFERDGKADIEAAVKRGMKL